MSSYGHILNLAVSRGAASKSKRVANNTYAERYVGDGTLEEPEAVGIRLHNTVVVKYTRTGELILDTGGWRTVTTKDRINSYTPNWVRVFSEKGEWRVSTRPYSEELPSVPYADGITLEINSLAGTAWTPVPGTYPSESQERLAAAARTKLKVDIAELVKKGERALLNWRQTLNEQGSLNTAGDCLYCQGSVSNFDGTPFAGTDHLWSHLREGYIFPSLYLLAYAAKGFRDPRHVFAIDISYNSARPGEYLRKYLYKVLSVSSEPQVDNVRFERYVEAAVEVLEKPSDFGYFGSDQQLWKKSAPTWTKHRDSDNIELANFDIVWEALKAEFPELFPDDLDEEGYPSRDFNEWPAIYVFGAGHWAVGHIDQIVVPVKLDGRRPVAVDNLHPAFIRICEFRDQVQAYPALDGAEERADNLNAEQITNGVKQYVEYLDDPRVTPYLEQITQWWITREVLEAEETFGYWTDDILKAHAAILEEEAYAELAGQESLL